MTKEERKIHKVHCKEVKGHTDRARGIAQDLWEYADACKEGELISTEDYKAILDFVAAEMKLERHFSK